MGAGPVARSVGKPAEAPTRIGAAATLSAGARVGQGWRQVLLEVLTGVAITSSVLGEARTQRWTQVVMGGSVDFRTPR